VAGLIQGGDNVEVSAATDHQAIFIGWAWDNSYGAYLLQLLKEHVF
jgi:hypothetical protein